ncbi:hypothetical protein J2Q21_04645 [Tenacibaculum finnmarkense genomovar ulcerans]|uniref:TrlF family AAA-like ATPase n=1 Tax=Tenacibaculum finnmarkense TaxID=2781243 RepID=UPI001EFC2170|nr:AAA family ATPase [Tenacibaculum finnmarkense]MCG8235869.1 hypothetical protein [Tenacibaculum finnmarkense genomovar ulcerans]
MKKYNKGAEWRKWDLHIHTPASIYQKFGGDTDKVWEKYIKDLEDLPEEFSVLGINDYLFIDGYERLRKEQIENNRLQGRKLLPVLEFRIEKFAGVDFRDLKRINLHVIFSDEIGIETIKSQFLNTLEQSYTLSSDDTKWTRAITIESVSELGNKIKRGVPADQLSRYGSDLDEGFNNLNLDEKQIFSSLEKDCFKGKYLIAVGKTEWADLKWTDASIATKKSIINNSSIVFTASDSTENFNKAKAQLVKQGVNSLLLDCSDAHYFSSDDDKDRIGNCNTWIKADPTFEGLKQIINEPNDRIFVGETPPILERVQNNRTKYIKELEINAINGYDGKYGDWFTDIKIPINKELSVVIGNKGSGKSAIADIIALCSGYNKHEDFSFLRTTKFRNGKHANNFEARVTWESDAKNDVKNLSITEIEQIEKVKYLPQGQFEKLTNEIESTTEFQKEIENVVFDHIDTSDRLAKKSFDELLNFHKKNVETEISFLKKEITSINKLIIDLETKENPNFKNQLEAKKVQKNEELNALVEPPVILDPNDDPVKKAKASEQLKIVDDIKDAIKVLEKQQTDNYTEKQKLLIQIKYLKDSCDSIKLRIEDFETFISPIGLKFKDFGLDISDIVNIKSDYTKIDLLIEEKQKELDKLKKELGEGELTETEKENSITVKLNLFQASLKEEKEKLDSEQQLYQKYIKEKSAFDLSKKNIIGDKTSLGTIEYYKEQIRYVDEELKQDLKKQYDNRIEKIKLIFNKKFAVIEIYKKIKSKMDETIKENEDLLEGYPISIDASLVLNSRFKNLFLGYINKSKSGTFKGSTEGESQLGKIISDLDFNSEIGIADFAKQLFEALSIDKRNKEDLIDRKYTVDQTNDVLGLYEYISSLNYLDYNYKLRQGEKDLEQLSPGERGALLLVFYLLLDKNDCPLIIDQPEDNLDNYSVANILVPFIKRAKKRRQIIMVTHNPNLAVVADAEQVISVSLDKENNNKFKFISGSIENEEINDSIVDVLEGAMPAFTTRRKKYFQAR